MDDSINSTFFESNSYFWFEIVSSLIFLLLLNKFDRQISTFVLNSDTKVIKFQYGLKKYFE